MPPARRRRVPGVCSTCQGSIPTGALFTWGKPDPVTGKPRYFHSPACPDRQSASEAIKRAAEATGLPVTEVRLTAEEIVRPKYPEIEPEPLPETAGVGELLEAAIRRTV